MQLIQAGSSVITLSARGTSNTKGKTNISKSKTSKSAKEKLALRRSDMGLPSAGSTTDKSTLTVLEIGGKEFYGINRKNQSPKTAITLKKVNPITKSHAEADAVQGAVNAGLKGKFKEATLTIDRAPCKACGVNGGLRSLARELGVERLKVVSPEGTTIVTPKL
jgi:deoxycytidylate deaminase